MPYDDILVHLGVPVETREDTAGWAEGEPDTPEQVPVPERAFGCCLFLPGSSEETGGRGSRQVKRPTLLLPPGLPVTRKDQVDVTAAELTGPDPVRWQVEGDPQPFGKPGEATIGSQVTLRRVEE